VELEFRASKADNPMDIYFLFDLSGSMGDEKEQLTNISQRLAEASIRREWKRISVANWPKVRPHYSKIPSKKVSSRTNPRPH
jgi:hypothetical protein